jgi:hypothetical protein
MFTRVLQIHGIFHMRGGGSLCTKQVLVTTYIVVGKGTYYKASPTQTRVRPVDSDHLSSVSLSLSFFFFFFFCCSVSELATMYICHRCQRGVNKPVAALRQAKAGRRICRALAADRVIPYTSNKQMLFRLKAKKCCAYQCECLTVHFAFKSEIHYSQFTVLPFIP